MTANVTFGSNFSGLENYLSNKVENDQNKSELIYFENVAPTFQQTPKGIKVEPNSMAREMQNHAKAENTRVQKPVMHTSFNFHQSEKLTREQAIEVSLSALKEVGITPDNHQITMYQHKDKEHPHVHCMVNRVGMDGKVHDNSFIANRLMVACDKVEKEKNLRPTQGRIFVHDPTAEKGYKVQSKAERGITSKPKQTKKERIQAVQDKVKTEFNRSLKTAKSFDEIKANLSKKGIETNIKTNKNGVYGISFKSDKIAVKASKIGIKAKEVSREIQQNQAEQNKNQQQNREKAAIEHNTKVVINRWKKAPQIFEQKAKAVRLMFNEYSENTKQDKEKLHEKYGFKKGKFDASLNAIQSARAEKIDELTKKVGFNQNRIAELKAKPQSKANFWDSRDKKEQVKEENTRTEKEIKALTKEVLDIKDNAKELVQNEVGKRTHEMERHTINTTLKRELKDTQKSIIQDAKRHANIEDIEKEILKRDNPKAFEKQEQRAKEVEKKQEEPERRRGRGR